MIAVKTKLILIAGITIWLSIRRNTIVSNIKKGYEPTIVSIFSGCGGLDLGLVWKIELAQKAEKW